MKKKIHGLAQLTSQFIEEKNITFNQFLELFDPYIERDENLKLPPMFRWTLIDNMKYDEIIIIHIINIKIKKHERKKIKRILTSNPMDNRLTFFFYPLIDKEKNIIGKELRFRNNQMYRMRDFKLYDLLFEFRKLLPNLLIDLEILLYGSL